MGRDAAGGWSRGRSHRPDEPDWGSATNYDALVGIAKGGAAVQQQSRRIDAEFAVTDRSVGAPVSRLLAALSWSGRELMFSLFVAFPSGTSGAVLQPDEVSLPRDTRAYVLEDPDDLLPGLSCVEYDLVYDKQQPADLEQVVRGWLRSSIASGASLAWFAFEGSFDFRHVLTSDIADQVYAVATRYGVELALADQEREGPGWIESLAAMRRRAGL